MRKILVFLLAVFVTTEVMATPPLRSGLYINTKAGAMRTIMKKDGKKADDVVIPFAVALGLRLRSVRVELEYMFSTKAKKDNYEQQTETAMAQLYYDIPFKSPIRPFLNVGGGRYESKIKEKDVFKSKRSGWAYNLGGGITWNVTNAVNIDIGYRYLMIDDFKTNTGTVKLQHHMAYIGWRYVF